MEEQPGPLPAPTVIRWEAKNTWKCFVQMPIPVSCLSWGCKKQPTEAVHGARFRYPRQHRLFIISLPFILPMLLRVSLQVPNLIQQIFPIPDQFLKQAMADKPGSTSTPQLMILLLHKLPYHLYDLLIRKPVTQRGWEEKPLKPPMQAEVLQELQMHIKKQVK